MVKIVTQSALLQSWEEAKLALRGDIAIVLTGKFILYVICGSADENI